MTPPQHDHAPLDADDAAPQPEAVTREATSDHSVDDHNLGERLKNQEATEPEQGGDDRSRILADGFAAAAKWALRLSVIIVTLYLVEKALAPLWVIILPLTLGLIISTVLWPPAAWLRRRGLPPALAAVITILGTLGVFAAVVTAIVPSVVDQAPDLASRSTEGVKRVQTWLQGPPLKVPPQQIDNAVQTINEKIQSSSEVIATGVFSGVTTVGTVLVTLVLSIILAFFFIKDGDRFLPWTRLLTGERIGAHVTEVATRAWHTLSGFIRTQAIVSLIDSTFIGIGLIALGVPLALPLCVITFFGGFIPIVGAFVAGALAVLVALVTKGMTTALIVLGVVVFVQQVEGHILQPLLQSRSMSLHPVLVLLGITAGSEKHGVIGGFLAVPVVATLAVLFRYIGEQVDLRSGTLTVSDLEYRTDRGRLAGLRTERLWIAAALRRQSNDKAKARREDAPEAPAEDETPAEGASTPEAFASRSGAAVPSRPATGTAPLSRIRSSLSSRFGRR